MRRIVGVTVVAVVALVWGSAVGGAASPKSALPRGGKVVASISIPTGYGGFAIGQHSVWALSDGASRLSRIDPKKNAVTARITVKPASPCPEYVCGEPAEGEGALWVPRASDNAVFRLDPSSNKVMAKIPVGAHPTAVAFTPGAVWVANGGGERNGRIEGPSISRVDPATNAVVATIELGPAAIASFNMSTRWRPGPAPFGRESQASTRSSGSIPRRTGSSRRFTCPSRPVRSSQWTSAACGRPRVTALLSPGSLVSTLAPTGRRKP